MKREPLDWVRSRKYKREIVCNGQVNFSSSNLKPLKVALELRGSSPEFEIIDSVNWCDQLSGRINLLPSSGLLIYTLSELKAKAKTKTNQTKPNKNKLNCTDKPKLARRTFNFGIETNLPEIGRSFLVPSFFIATTKINLLH